MGKENEPRKPRYSMSLDDAARMNPSATKKNQQNRLSYQSLGPNKPAVFRGMKGDNGYFGICKTGSLGKNHALIYKHLKLVALVVLIMVSLSLLDSIMLSVIRNLNVSQGLASRERSKHKIVQHGDKDGTQILIHEELFNLASSTTTEVDHHESSMQWNEPGDQASKWRPCSNIHKPREQGHGATKTGYILVSANGGLNQQRVAVCNAVAVAALLNASLVLPKFLYSSVWKDASQFSDIYQEKHFMSLLREDVDIVRELPTHLRSLDFDAIGSQITDADILKESSPTDFVRIVLPLLQKHGVVHFLGFGNRLGFDPFPSQLQRLRCKCNFHALKFTPRIQAMGSLLVKRIRNYNPRKTEIDKQLLGDHMKQLVPVPLHPLSGNNDVPKSRARRYLALHLRFEQDMVAYSMCYFGGGEEEKVELQAYRETHFPRLVAATKNNSIPPEELRRLGRCPLTPEEAGLVLSALGFPQDTYVYLAGSQIYGGESRMRPLSRLFPNTVTKEDLMTPVELELFKNFSSQLAALDFIVCAASDVFAMTDSGSQLSSLVSGFRVYHGRGRAPTIRPNKRMLAQILSESSSSGGGGSGVGGATPLWDEFAGKVRIMVREDQTVRERPWGRSIYRHPRSPECMCRA